MSTLKERLLEFVEYKHMSVRSFETRCGISNSYIANLKAMTTDKLVKILNAFPEINQNWLLTGEGEMLNAVEEDIKPTSGELLDALRQTIEAKSSVITVLQEKVDFADERIKMYQEKIQKLQEQLEELKKVTQA